MLEINFLFRPNRSLQGNQSIEFYTEYSFAKTNRSDSKTNRLLFKQNVQDFKINRSGLKTNRLLFKQNVRDFKTNRSGSKTNRSSFHPETKICLHLAGTNRLPPKTNRLPRIYYRL